LILLEIYLVDIEEGWFAICNELKKRDKKENNIG
jgi:hypothetical protein